MWFLLLAVLVILAAAPWQNAEITDPQQSVSQTGFDAFPAIALTIGFNALAIFALRYSKGLIRIALLLTVAIITSLALYAPSFAAFLQKPILTKSVEVVTGVAGWEDQKSQVLSSVSDYSFSAITFPFVSAALLIWIVTGVLASKTVSKRVKTDPAPELWVN